MRCRGRSRCATDYVLTITVCSRAADCSATPCCCETSRTDTTTVASCPNGWRNSSRSTPKSHSIPTPSDARSTPLCLLNFNASPTLYSLLVYKRGRVLSRTSYQGDVSKNRGSHTDIPVTYILTSLRTHSLTYLLECCCVYLVHPKFDLTFFSNKSRQNSLLAVSVK